MSAAMNPAWRAAVLTAIKKNKVGKRGWGSWSVRGNRPGVFVVFHVFFIPFIFSSNGTDNPKYTLSS